MEKHKSNKPLIRFPEFKDSWEHKQLSELLYESKKRNENLKFGKDKVLSVSGEYGIVNQIQHLGRSYAGVSVHQYHVVDIGDIVYTKSPLKENPYGIIRLNKSKAGIVSTLYAVYKPNKQTAYAPFLGYYFSLDANTNRYLRPLVKKGAKNDMKVNNEYVLNDKIYVPTLSEQKRIASFFDVLDKKIEELKCKKLLLDDYKKGVVQKIFSRKLRFKDDKGKYFPKWETKKLGEIATFFSGGTPDTGKKSYYNGKIPFIKSGEINSKKTEQFITEEGLKNSSAKMVKKGDLLYALYGATSGESGISKISGAINQAVLCIRSIHNKHFLLAYFQLNKTHITGRFLQGGQGNLSADIVKALVIDIPSKEEQNKIAAFLNILDCKIDSTIIQIQQTEQFRKGLLQKMFC
ncbi:MAG: restriction endonuclease subunit S [Chitinophagaceae bacterium]|nr:MAG: restriction endonuclease subunit S [Chitinophagaceae bacterium]